MKSFRVFILSSMRELVFGFEDSLVSTLGTVTGIAIGSQSTYIVILSAFVLIASESVSMAAGSYLSTKSATEAEGARRHTKKYSHLQTVSPTRGAVVMGISYVIGGFVPVLPYFFLPLSQAMVPSIILTIIVLFLIGWWKAVYTKQNRVKSGMEMVVVSLIAAGIGYLIGMLVHKFLVLS